MPDVFAALPELSALLTQARSLTQRFQVVAEEVDGLDPSEQVRIRLAPDGRPASVVIGAGWRSMIGAEGLGGAIIAAYQQAVQRRLASWANAVSDSPRPSHEVEQPQRTTVEPGPSPVDLYHLVVEVTDRLDDLVRDVEQRANETSTAYSSDRRVVASVQNGQLTSVTVDAHWASGASRDALQLAVTTTLRNAFDANAALTAGSLANTGPFAELRAALTDPMHLLAGLDPTQQE